MVGRRGGVQTVVEGQRPGLVGEKPAEAVEEARHPHVVPVRGGLDDGPQGEIRRVEDPPQTRAGEHDGVSSHRSDPR